MPGIAVLAAPTNLGLRPPEPGGVPGCGKAPEALRQAGLHTRLISAGGSDGGVVLPGRYVEDPGRAAGTLRNQRAILDHSRRLADRLGELVDEGARPLVLGGDCSLLLGVGLALARRGSYGLVHLDGHTDFRNPGNSDACASLAGEDLAAMVGRHWPEISEIEGLGPYFAPRDVVHVGCRDDDEELDEVRQLLGAVLPARVVREHGVPDVARTIRTVVQTDRVAGYWLHLDVDILDPTFMSAVDSPDPGGLEPAELVDLLVELAPGALGADVTVFDPDLDPDGRYARLLSEVIGTGLRYLGTAAGPVAAPAE